jgi:hypothetical protein
VNEITKDKVGYTFTDMRRPLEIEEVEAPRIARQSDRESGKIVSPTHRPSLLLVLLVFSYVRG